MVVLVNRAKVSTSTTGTGTITLGSAVDGYQGFAEAGVSDGETVSYVIEDQDGNNGWEIGTGTFTASGTTLSRTVVESSNSGNAINLSGDANVFITPLADDIVPSSGGTFSGDVALSSANLDVDGYVDLKHHSSGPTHAEGRIFYDSSNGALAVYNDESDITLQVGQEEYIRAYNSTGSTITNGTPVYITGQTGAIPTVAPAVANDTYAKSLAVGLATHDIEDSTSGYVTVRGVVSDVDTSHLTVGEQVHVAPSGGTQSDAPTYPNFPTDVGVCLSSNASTGSIYVKVQEHSFEAIRITGNSHFDANLTVDGDLTVNGTQTVTNTNNISLNASFNYLNSGDTITDITFTGTGVNDLEFKGHYNGTTSNKAFYVRISDSQSQPDKFEWSLDNFSTIEDTDIAITGDEQELEDGISVKFNDANGHDQGDTWSGSASPSNVDTGFASNRNTGTSGVGYTHIGMYYDVSTNKWTFFDAYAPEPEGAIDTSDSSFSYATVIAGTFEGSLSGNATTASTLETSRTIGLSGDVSGSVSFDGGSNVTITTTVADDSHNHVIGNVDGLQSALDEKAPLASPTFTGTVTFPAGQTFDGRDVSADGSKLDGIETGATADQTAGEIKTAYESNADTNAFTDALQTKLSGIETGATADQTASEIKTAYESNANTNAFTDALQTKLSGIEASADVTDTANVTAAGALMDSEVTNLAQVKSFDSSDYATAAQGTLADSAVQPNDTVSLGAVTTSGLTVNGSADINGVVEGNNFQAVHSNEASAATVDLDLDTAGTFGFTLAQNTTVTFSNIPSSGKSMSWLLTITTDSGGTGYTVTWPASIIWAESTAPTLSSGASQTDVFNFFTHDGGTTVYGFFSGRNMG